MPLQTKIYLDLTASDGLIDSAFIVKLRDAFKNPALPVGQKLWDANFTALNDPKRFPKIADDIGRAFKALFLRREQPGTPPPAPTTVNSAEKVVVDFLTANNWPQDIANFPVPGPWAEVAFRRYEIAAAMYIIMSAFQRDGSGGGPASLPPSLPV